MTKKELKEMIRTAIMEETSKSHGNIGAQTPEGEVLGFLDEQEEEETEEVETEETEEVEVEEPKSPSPEEPARKMSPEEQEVQSSLEKALEAAKNLDNEKLVTQIGNTITYFTRSEVIKEEKEIEDIRTKFLRTLRLPNDAL
jgi:FtsZ-interacting cell division protein YlmF